MKKINIILLSIFGMLLFSSCDKTDDNNTIEPIIPKTNAKVFIPNITFGKTKEQIKDFEITKGRTEIESTNSDELVFKTNSSVFSKLVYKFKNDRSKAVVVYFVDDNAKTKYINKFSKLLLQNGFVKKTTSEFYNINNNVNVEVKGNEVVYENLFMPNHRTFKTFPFSAVTQIPWGATEDEIRNYEANNGGVYDDKNSQTPLEVDGVKKENVDLFVFNRPNANDDLDNPTLVSYHVIRKDYTTSSGISHLKGMRIVTQSFYGDDKTKLFFVKNKYDDVFLTQKFADLSGTVGFQYVKSKQTPQGLYYFFKAQKQNLTMMVVYFRIQQDDGKIIDAVKVELTEVVEQKRE